MYTSINGANRLVPAAKFLIIVGLLAQLGCNRHIDARQTYTEQGLIYVRDDNSPLSGVITNTGISGIAKDRGAQLLPSEGSCEVPVKNGLFDGVVVCKNLKGDKIAEIPYSKGRQDGALKVWASDSGKLMTSVEIHDGAVNGLFERFNAKSGKIISSVNYVSGKNEGEQKDWDITGEKLLTELTWKNGAKTGVYRYGEREEHYNAGLRDGAWKICELNRATQAERYDQNDQKVRVYHALADQLGGTYFLPALVESPAEVSCTEEIYKDGVKQNADASQAELPK